jgi:hypothetical protein
MHLCIFITRKLHDIKFIVDRLSLISMLFIPCISYVLIPLYNQMHNIVSVQTYCDMFRHEYATFREYVCQLQTV